MRLCGWCRGASYLAERHILRRHQLVAHADFFDLRLKFFAEDAIGRHLYKRGAIERVITQHLIEHLALRPGELTLDVGANIGWYSLILDRISPPTARVIAFEPDPLNFALLAENLAANQAEKVLAVDRAVSDQEGIQTLYRYPRKNTGRHSLLPEEGRDAIPVEVVTLDGYLARHGHEGPIGFVKIDVEGHELPVLRGAKGAIRQARTVLIELSKEKAGKAGHPIEEAVALLLDAGLTPHVFGPLGLHPVAPSELVCQAKTTNVLWLRRP